MHSRLPVTIMRRIQPGFHEKLFRKMIRLMLKIVKTIRTIRPDIKIVHSDGAIGKLVPDFMKWVSMFTRLNRLWDGPSTGNVLSVDLLFGQWISPMPYPVRLMMYAEMSIVAFGILHQAEGIWLHAITCNRISFENIIEMYGYAKIAGIYSR